MDVTQNTIIVSCHCGAARQTLAPKKGAKDLFSKVSFCHCDTCRHLTGLLCTSYVPIAPQPPSLLTGLESYSVSPSSTRYFCSTCGCHVFRATRPSPSAPLEQWEWEVATGSITHAPEFDTFPKDWHHTYIKDTQDGGLSPWLPTTNPSPPNTTTPSVSPDDTLRASCHCTSISLLITRPSHDPTLNPDSPYPDLLLPYHSTPSATVSNPSREKWYLRPAPSKATQPSLPASPSEPEPTATLPPHKYLAGTCACPTCRLTSGFEIQTWAFIPRRNISLVVSPPGNNPKSPPSQPLDFTNLPASLPLKTYESSPGRMREFCSTCGATVFWHDKFRPDLIDVSAGLFHPGTTEGSRAEGWLAWWTGRVSFAEEAGTGRTGGAKRWGEGVIGALEGGMRAECSRRHQQTSVGVREGV